MVWYGELKVRHGPMQWVKVGMCGTAGYIRYGMVWSEFE